MLMDGWPEKKAWHAKAMPQSLSRANGVLPTLQMTSEKPVTQAGVPVAESGPAFQAALTLCYC